MDGSSVDGGKKVCLNGPGHLPKMAAMPIYVKNPSSLKIVGRLLWHLVWSMGHLGPSWFWLVQMITLGLPRPTCIFHQGQIWLIMLLLEKEWKLSIVNYCSQLSHLVMQSTCSQLKKATWVLKVKVTPWPLTKVTQILKSKLVFLWNYWTSWNQILYGNSSEQGNENLSLVSLPRWLPWHIEKTSQKSFPEPKGQLQWNLIYLTLWPIMICTNNDFLIVGNRSHDRDGHHDHIWTKSLKKPSKSSPLEQVGQFQRNLMFSIEDSVQSNDDPELILNYFRPRSSFVT